MNIEELKQNLRDVGVTIFPDMQGPTASFKGHAVMAVTRNLTDEKLIDELAKISPVNFSYYARTGDKIRYAVWKKGTPC